LRDDHRDHGFFLKPTNGLPDHNKNRVQYTKKTIKKLFITPGYVRIHSSCLIPFYGKIRIGIRGLYNGFGTLPHLNSPGSRLILHHGPGGMPEKISKTKHIGGIPDERTPD
jgi:hypothetical protein